MLKRSRLVLALSFSAAVLCGCGGAAGSAQPSPSAPAADKKQQYEAAKADCMKQKGFKYVAYVQPEPPDSEESRKRTSGDYQAMRKFREKYGFGIFAVHVYPKLVELAADMATCLKGEGYAVSDSTPDAMSDHGSEVFRTQEDKLGREQSDEVPDVAPPVKEGELPMMYAPTLTPEQARPYLAKEIKAALDDLECGKDFYPVFMPKRSAAVQQVNQQFGM